MKWTMFDLGVGRLTSYIIQQPSKHNCSPRIQESTFHARLKHPFERGNSFLTDAFPRIRGEIPSLQLLSAEADFTIVPSKLACSMDVPHIIKGARSQQTPFNVMEGGYLPNTVALCSSSSITCTARPADLSNDHLRRQSSGRQEAFLRSLIGSRLQNFGPELEKNGRG
ncbi:hypothetical protein R1flu_006250 [Riccia fluitans]|uniref:Uncharacterized protein n=1 Tax=Riccia fluitans TaxID=41844 RepID=A0ABD1YVH8_9MARC